VEEPHHDSNCTEHSHEEPALRWKVVLHLRRKILWEAEHRPVERQRSDHGRCHGDAGEQQRAQPASDQDQVLSVHTGILSHRRHSEGRKVSVTTGTSDREWIVQPSAAFDWFHPSTHAYAREGHP
jgi:hypothetical protein